MGLIEAIKDKTLQTALNQLRDLIINPLLTDYGRLTSLTINDKTLACKVKLLGLEHEELEVSCSQISIADDLSTITLSNFKANKLFLENALNTFATKPLNLPDNPAVRTGIKILKSVIG